MWGMAVDLAVTFWFYKKPKLCLNRLRLIKKYNPSVKIFGLFGGNKQEAKKYQKYLAGYLDDFYTSPFTNDNWKWRHGDLMILDWYQNRGKGLGWDSVIIIQWDALVFDSLSNQFPQLKKDQIFLSGLKKLDQKTEKRWWWTGRSKKERKIFLDFLRHVKNKYDYSGPMLCCLFILQIFPRSFFEKYLKTKDRELGFLEYKIPIYAQIFGHRFYKRDLGTFWRERQKDLPLNALPKKIKKSYIEKELKKTDGWRIFHPYYKIWPME